MPAEFSSGKITSNFNAVVVTGWKNTSFYTPFFTPYAVGLSTGRQFPSGVL